MPARPNRIWHVVLGAASGVEMVREPSTEGQNTAWLAHIDRAGSVEGDPIPGHEDYVMVANAFPGTLLCAVAAWDADIPLCTFTVVTSDRFAGRAWRALHEGYPDCAASRDQVPRAPFCAARIEVGAAVDPDASRWLDGYRAAVAWTWVDSSRRLDS